MNETEEVNEAAQSSVELTIDVLSTESLYALKLVLNDEPEGVNWLRTAVQEKLDERPALA